jgi:hypothetical protein
VYCNYQQHNWSYLLPLTKFAYNNALSSTTGLLLFYTNKGYHPNLMVHPEWGLASSWAQDFTLDIDQIQTALKEQINSTQFQYQVLADVCCTPAPEFTIGSLAFVKVQFFQTTQPSKKLAEWCFGGDHPSQTSVIHSTTTRQRVCSPSGLPCLNARTFSPELHSKEGTFSTSTSRN